jgi:large subunit ribosomal protein L13
MKSPKELAAMKTWTPKPEDIRREWVLVDAEDKILGRLATQVAMRLRGKHKPEFAPHVDNGDFVVVVNADKIRVTGNKLNAKKYYRHSGYPGGIKETGLREMLATKPEEVIRKAVRGMLPKNSLGRQLLKKLKVYAGTEHPHEAQQPQKIEL